MVYTQFKLLEKHNNKPLETQELPKKYNSTIK